MSTISTIALSLAIAHGTASIASAAAKHPVRHHAMVVVPAAGYQAYGRVGRSGLGLEPTYIYIQDHDNRISYGYRG